LASLLLVLILILDFAISLWNAYSSGYNVALLNRTGGSGWLRAVSYSGLGLGFAGIAYVLSVVLSAVAYYFGYVSSDVVNAVVAFAFLVFGALIIGFGAMVTIQSIAVAMRQRGIWNILIALWNSFAEIWDIAVYVESFGDAVSILKGDRSEDEGVDVILVIMVALLIAFFLTYSAYKHGQKKAMGSAGGSYDREPF